MSASSSPIFTWHRRVEFSETDAAGIAHFSSFFLYMEQAEHALFRSLGLSVFAKHSASPYENAGGLNPLDVTWPRVHCSCDFSAPAFFEDNLTIDVLIDRLGSKSLNYKHIISRSGELIATGHITTVCSQVDSQSLRLVSCPIPDGIRKQFQSLIDMSTTAPSGCQLPTKP